MTSLTWFDNDSVAEAVEAARRSQRPLLVDFWHPTCLGCAKLAAVTYADDGVREVLASTFVPLKYNTTTPNDWFRRLNGKTAHVWHPHLVVMDHRLIEGKRIIGYQPPAPLLAQLFIGVGVLAMHEMRYQQALAAFQRAAGCQIPASLAAEALYWAGVAAYRVEKTLDAVKRYWVPLLAHQPDGDWARRADCLDVAIPPDGFDPRHPDSVVLVNKARLSDRNDADRPESAARR